MPQLLLPDNIPPLVKASSTTCTLAATHLGQPTRIQIGGQAYKLSSTLTLNTATTGLGGLDTGVLGNSNNLYYVYACTNSSGVVGLVASLAIPSTGPAGFTTRNKLVGAFYSMDSGSQIGSTVSIVGVAESEFQRNITNTLSNFSPAGTGALNSLWWRRQGNMMQLEWSFQLGTTGTALGGAMDLGLPVGVVADTTQLSSLTTGVSALGRGVATWWDKSVPTNDFIIPCLFSNTSIRFIKSNNAILGGTDIITNSNDEMSLKVDIPISGWSKTLLG